MATQAMQRLPQFNSQNMSNTLWAFASLNHHPGPMLLKVLQRELVHKLPHFTSQGIENVLWAFATLGHHPGQPAPTVNQHICSCCLAHPLQIQACCVGSQYLNSILCLAGLLSGTSANKACSHVAAPSCFWSCCQTQNRSRDLPVLAVFSPLFAVKCTVQNSSLAWHCLFAGEETLMAAAQHIGSILRQFNHQNLALALWAFAKLGWRPHSGLLADACRHALLTVDTINPQNLSNILWALATMEFIPSAMLLEVCLPLGLACIDSFVGH